jgi:hypothetical protein
MAVLQGKLRGARLTVWLQGLFAYSPIHLWAAVISRLSLRLVNFKLLLWEAGRLGGWEAGSSVGRALAVADWQWEFVGERCHRRSQIGEVGLRAC